MEGIVRHQTENDTHAGGSNPGKTCWRPPSARTGWSRGIGYLWPRVADWFNASPADIMRVVGGVEIAAGMLVLLAPRLGSLLVAAWLGTIVTNLVAMGIDTDTEYWDIALRDFGLMIGALALFLLSNAYGRRVRTSTAPPDADRRYLDTDDVGPSRQAPGT